jgi:hypothetical protein
VKGRCRLGPLACLAWGSWTINVMGNNVRGIYRRLWSRVKALFSGNITQHHTINARVKRDKNARNEQDRAVTSRVRILFSLSFLQLSRWLTCPKSRIAPGHSRRDYFRCRHLQSAKRSIDFFLSQLLVHAAINCQIGLSPRILGLDLICHFGSRPDATLDDTR